MRLSDQCVSGVIHEGTAEGKWETINGVDCYVATPASDYPKEKVLLMLTDVFGPQFINNQLIADSFAKNGFKTVVPDYFNGDPIAPDALDPGKTFDRDAWFAKHGDDATRPPLDKVIAALKEAGITEFGTAGYCFGARYCFDLAFGGIAKVVMIAHPGRLTIPDDLEKYFNIAKAPLLINSCDIDRPFPPEAQQKADEIFGDGKFAPGYRRAHWEGCSHGFAVRGDVSNPKIKAGKEGAFKETVAWMQKYL